MCRSIYRSFIVLSVFAVAGLLGGCGSSKKEGAQDQVATATRVDNSSCTNACHAGTLSPVTGKNLVTEWYSSAHKKGPVLVDCQSCHGGGSMHWGLGPIPNPNPDKDGVCSASACHSALGSPHLPKLTPAILASATIWDNMSSAGYVTSQNIGICRDCHNPHNNTVLQQNRDWAESGHGDTKAQPWFHYDFKARDDCNRCHTTTGFIKYITTGDKKAWAAANSSDKTKEVLRCDGCHVDYSWKLRALGPVRADYTNVPTFTYSDSGESNVCLNCHIGRESGESVKNALFANNTSFRKRSFVNSHYLTAGGTLFGTTGYEFTALDYVDPAFFDHKNIGRVVTNTTSNPEPNLTAGPCIGCHVYEPAASDARHSFLPVTKDANDVITAIVSPICVKCHVKTPASLEASKAALNFALEALRAQLAVKGYIFRSSNPYFFTTATGTTGVTNWVSPGDTDKSGNTTGKNNMGSAFNYNLLVHDPGAFAHNDIYTKRLIIDSIDWLFNNILVVGTTDAEAAINALTFLDKAGNMLKNPATGVAYTAPEIAATKAAAIVYLLGGPGGVRP